RSFLDTEVKTVLNGTEGIVSEWVDEPELYRRTAEAIAGGDVVGWFQGSMEWGPRALGNRSIVAHPGLSEMKDILNSRIKHRESLGPFAPSIREDHGGDFFGQPPPPPFMTMVSRPRPEVRDALGAVNHVDNTSRLQTVSRKQNPRYYALIEAFRRKTGLP